MAEKSKVSSHPVQAEDDIIAQKYTSLIGSAVSNSRSPSSGRWTSIPQSLMHGWIFPTCGTPGGTKYPIPQLGICILLRFSKSALFWGVCAQAARITFCAQVRTQKI
jgi:hypothetical protein